MRKPWPKVRSMDLVAVCAAVAAAQQQPPKPQEPAPIEILKELRRWMQLPTPPIEPMDCSDAQIIDALTTVIKLVKAVGHYLAEHPDKLNHDYHVSIAYRRVVGKESTPDA